MISCLKKLGGVKGYWREEFEYIKPYIAAGEKR